MDYLGLFLNRFNLDTGMSNCVIGSPSMDVTTVVYNLLIYQLYSSSKQVGIGFMNLLFFYQSSLF